MKKIRFLTFISVGLLFIIVFLFFRHLEYRELVNVETNIETILRNEMNLSNSYALSKTILDLENLKLFAAAKLQDSKSPFRIYYDSIENKRIIRVKYLDLFLTNKIKLKAMNGNQFDLYYIKTINIFAFVVEFSIYFILLAILIYIPGAVKKQIDSARNRSKVLEIEKKLIVDLNKQVRHDIASPITALGAVSSLLRDVDPNIKEVLDNALNRAREILRELHGDSLTIDKTDLLMCLRNIINEKQLLWGNSNHAEFELYYANSGAPVFVNFSASTLKRNFSNFFNNSFEAFFNCPISSVPQIKEKLKIKIYIDFFEERPLVRIIDNGPGFPSELIEFLGSKSCTFGKEKISGSGNGIGLLYAYNSFMVMGGKLFFANHSSGGAQISCHF